MDNLKLEYFSKINLDDPFFDSLKSDYKEFPNWFSKKREKGESAFIFINNKQLK